MDEVTVGARNIAFVWIVTIIYIWWYALDDISIAAYIAKLAKPG
jgi:hypothetical protein